MARGAPEKVKAPARGVADHVGRQASVQPSPPIVPYDLLEALDDPDPRRRHLELDL